MNETNQTLESGTPRQQQSAHSRSGMAWGSLVVFILLLLMLAIFILQNSNRVQISFFGYQGSLSFGVAMLLAAITGSLLTVLIGSVRIVQLKAQRKQLRKHSRTES